MRCAILAAGLALAAAGCGSDEAGPDRRAVAAYIDEVNEVQRGAADVFEAANETYTRFARRELRGEQASARLRRAEDGITGARNRIRELPAPPAAAGLRRGLLDVMTRNITLARQTRLLATYELEQRDVTRRLDRLDRALRRALRDERDPARQAAALRRFATGAAAARTTLEGMRAPAVLEPAHEAQLRRLGRIGTAAAQLRSAIARRDPRRVARLVKAFRRAGRSTGGDGAARRAFAAYGQRFQELNAAYAAVQRTTAKLERGL